MHHPLAAQVHRFRNPEQPAESLMNEVVHTSPTIGSNVEEIVVKNTHFLMWDIGGQESLRSSWNTYYSNTEFIILVVDSIDRERLSITKEELYRMLAHEDLRKAAVLIFANKQDMKGCMTAAEISKYLTLSSIKDHPWHIQSCCALTGEGHNDILNVSSPWLTSGSSLQLNPPALTDSIFQPFERMMFYAPIDSRYVDWLAYLLFA
ncbi:ADP-ribosylation factor-like protein 5B [Chelonia mydas]|uniref:ADP-ribosylation factor-like protein 6 n=1 Tax=Chelonia mydas TaxID=8469 RepID=M7BY48_CHEMY|nr:ADP-ribosylation factor-like protein 5B [Chelonia mydas]